MTAAGIGNDSVFVPVMPSFDRFFTGVEDASKKAGKQGGKSLSDELTREVEKGQRRVDSAMGKYERAQNRAADAADKTRLAELKLTEAMDDGSKSASQIADLTAKYEKARRDQTTAENNAERASKDLTNAQGDLTKATQEQEDATSAGAEEMGKWALSAEEAEQASKDLEGAQKGLEIGIAATAGAITAAVGGLIGIGSTFHDMSRTIAVSSGATGDDLRALEESAMAVATTVPVAFNDAGDALASLNTMTGETGPDLERLTTQVLEASNLLGEDGTANAAAFGNALSQWEVDAATGADAMDGLFAVTQNFGIGLDAVTGHLNTYGSVLNNAGFSMEESAILFGSLEKSGLSVSRIMPGLNAAFRGWAGEGLNVQDMLTDTVGKIESAETAQEALALATDTFGAEGAQRLTTAIRNGSFELQDFQTALGDTEGSIERTAAENRTLEESFQLLGNEAMVALEPLATELFDALIPAVESAGEALTDMIDWVSENEELVKGLVVVVGGLAGGLLAARAAVVTFTVAQRAMNVATLLATGGFKALDSAMRKNVFVLIATAVAGLVAGLVYFFRETETGQEIWGKFTDALGAGWDWVMDKIQPGIDWLIGVFDTVKEAWVGITDILFKGDFNSFLGLEEDSGFVDFLFNVREGFISMVDWIKSAWENNLKPALAAVGAFVTDTLWPILQTAFEWIGDAWSALSTGIQWAWENLIKPTFDFLWQVAQVTLGVIGTVILAPLLLAWNVLSEGIQWAWENLIKPAWDALSAAATWMYENVLQPVFGFIGEAWSLLVDGIKWYWENQLKPAWQGLQNAATFMWENVLSPVFGFIGDAWSFLVDGIKWYWENVLLVAWQALQTAATWMYENILKPVFSWIGDRWDDLSTAIAWAYENIIQPAWDALQNALTWLYENIIEPTFQWISDRWDDMANALEVGWRWIDENVFQALGDGLDVVKGWFDSAVDGIGKIWDGLKAAAAAPVKFVIDTVWNNGILKAWNSIAEYLPGIDTVDPYEPAWLGDYHRGTPSIVPGPRSVNRDNLEFISTDGRYGIGLAGEEGIAHQHVVTGLGGPAVWDQLNRAGRTRGPQAVRETLMGTERHGRESAAFNRGGIIDLGNFSAGGMIGPNAVITTDVQRAMLNIVAQKYPGLTLTSATRAGQSGFHGSGLATDWSNGSTSTPMQLALAQDIATTYPGSAQLIYDHPGWTGNIANGSNVGAFGGYYNLAEAGRHDHHVHWAMTEPPTMPFGGGVFEGGNDGGSGGGGGFFSWISNFARGVWDRLVSPIRGWIDNQLGDWGDSKFADVPGSFLSGIGDAAWDKITSLFGSAGGGGSVDVSDISGPIVDQVEEVFARHGFTGQQWEDAKWIVQQESNWDPTAVNPSSGAFGLFQFNPMGGDTLGQYLPDRNPDPAVQADAGARYMRNRYGDPTAARRWWEEHQWYDEGGYLQPGITRVVNETGKPEPVLNPWQWDQIRGLVAGVGELSPALQDWVDNGIDELERIANGIEEGVAAADRGFREWAAADEERGRMPTPEEVALHYGADAAATAGDSLLGMIGLGGIIGSTPNDSLLELLQVGATNLNDVYGFDLPVLAGDELQPLVVIGDDGRVLGTVIEADDDVVDESVVEDDEVIDPSPSVEIDDPEAVATTVAASTAAADNEQDATSQSTTRTVSTDSGPREIVVQVEGDAISTATLQKLLDKIVDQVNGEIGDLKVRVEKIEGQMVASVVGGVAAGIV